MMERVIATVLSVGMMLTPMSKEGMMSRLGALTAAVDVLVNGKQATWNKYTIGRGDVLTEFGRDQDDHWIKHTENRSEVILFYSGYGFNKKIGYYGTENRIDIRLGDIEDGEYQFGTRYYSILQYTDSISGVVYNGKAVFGRKVVYGAFPGPGGTDYGWSTYDGAVTCGFQPGDTRGDFIESVTAKVGTYPDWDTQDGFWYELQDVVED